MSELEKSMSGKYAQVSRALTEVAKETKVDVSHLLVQV